MSRVRSDVWCSALVRRVFSAGGYAVIARKGNAEAGAIHIRVTHRDGRESLYSPAAQALVDDGTGGSDRFFECRLDRQPLDAVERVLQSEARFDSDFWVVGIELEEADAMLNVVAG